MIRGYCIQRPGNTEVNFLFAMFLLTRKDIYYNIGKDHLLYFALPWLYKSAGYYDKSQTINDEVWSLNPQWNPTPRLIHFANELKSALSKADMIMIMDISIRSMERIAIPAVVLEFMNWMGWASKIRIIEPKDYEDGKPFMIPFGYRAMLGKSRRVLLVSPFAPLMKQQVDNGNFAKIHATKRLVLNDDGIPSPAEIIAYRFPYYSFGNIGPHANFHESLKAVLDDLSKLWDQCDTVLVSCGCYGIQITEAAAAAGKHSIYLGGEMQLLFGIHGNRWRENVDVAKRIESAEPSAWINVPDSYRPPNADLVEGACYW